jgi:hypothetical protein
MTRRARRTAFKGETMSPVSSSSIRLTTLSTLAAVLLATLAGCGSSDGETATGGAGGATGGAGGAATGGAGGAATGGAGGATGGAGGATGGAGGATGGAGGATGGAGGAATGGMGGMAMGGAGGATAAPLSCMYAAKDNPNKAEVTYMITDASADANLMRASYTGETRSLVTYNKNPILKMLNFGFSFPFVGLTPTPCTSFTAVLSGVEMPAAGITANYAVPTINSVTVAESPECSPLVTTWNMWSQAGPGTVTFTKVDGPNVEFDFSFPMGPKHSNKAAGTFTIKGHVKSPCFFVM